MCPTPLRWTVNCRTNWTMSGALSHIGYQRINGTANMDSISRQNWPALNANMSSNSACTSGLCARLRQFLGK